MTVYAVRPKDEYAWLICKTVEELSDTLTSYDPGWAFDVEIREMSDEELSNLAEFDGW